jgi:hypothetical protein
LVNQRSKKMTRPIDSAVNTGYHDIPPPPKDTAPIQKIFKKIVPQDKPVGTRRTENKKPVDSLTDDLRAFTFEKKRSDD